MYSKKEVKMAKPIRATPKLTAKETSSFISEMINVEKTRIPASEKKLAKKICSEFSC